MHELSMCEAIARKVVDRAAGRRVAGGRRPRRSPAPGRARRDDVLVGDAHRDHRTRRRRARDRARAGCRRVLGLHCDARRSTCPCWRARPAARSTSPCARATSCCWCRSRPSSSSTGARGRAALMGRFHRHADGTEHSHEHDEAITITTTITARWRGVTSATTAATSTRARAASRCSSASSTRTTESRRPTAPSCRATACAPST